MGAAHSTAQFKIHAQSNLGYLGNRHKCPVEKGNTTGCLLGEKHEGRGACDVKGHEICAEFNARQMNWREPSMKTHQNAVSVNRVCSPVNRVFHCECSTGEGVR